MENKQTGRFKSLQNKCFAIFEAKNKDYGNSYQSTYDKFGPVACSIRLSDKLERFITLTKGDVDAEVDESIEDTLLDMANYALLTIIAMENGSDVE